MRGLIHDTVIDSYRNTNYLNYKSAVNIWQWIGEPRSEYTQCQICKGEQKYQRGGCRVYKGLRNLGVCDKGIRHFDAIYFESQKSMCPNCTKKDSLYEVIKKRYYQSCETLELNTKEYIGSLILPLTVKFKMTPKQYQNWLELKSIQFLNTKTIQKCKQKSAMPKMQSMSLTKT